MPRKKNEGTNKEERSERNGRVWLSEQAAADYLGVTKRTLQRWRSGVVRANGQVVVGPVKLMHPHGVQPEYTTWSFRMLKDRNNDNKTLDIIRDKLNGSCYEDYDDDSNIDKRVKEIEGLAKETGVVIVYGHSDDLIEFRGAIDDELGAWEGGIFLIHNSAHPNVEKLDSTDLYRLSIEERRNCIFAKWPWHYKTDIPHKEFTVFYDKPEDDEKEWTEIYCSGIIFSVKDLA